MGTLPDHVNICQSVGTFSRLFTRPWEHLFACRNIFWVVGTFSSLKEHFLLRGKICQTTATWPNPWENFTECENIYQIMGIFTGPQTFLFYWPWEHLPDRGNITWPWEHFPVCGNIFQTMGIFTQPWEYLPDRKNICQTVGRFFLSIPNISLTLTSVLLSHLMRLTCRHWTLFYWTISVDVRYYYVLYFLLLYHVQYSTLCQK